MYVRMHVCMVCVCVYMCIYVHANFICAWCVHAPVYMLVILFLVCTYVCLSVCPPVHVYVVSALYGYSMQLS